MQYVVNGLISAGLLVPAGLGFLIILRVCRFFHFGYGVSITLGAYGTLLFMGWGWPIPVAIIASLVINAGIGAAMETAVFAPIRRRGTDPLIPFLASLGAYVAIVNVLVLVFGNRTKSIPAWPVETGITVLGAFITKTQLGILGVAVICAVAAWGVLHRSQLGCRLRAVASNPELALVTGLRVHAIRVLAMALGSVFGAIAGILIACDTAVNPRMGMYPLIGAFVVVIVGGGRLWSTIGAAILVGLAQHVGVIWISTDWKDTVTYLVLIVFLVFKPGTHRRASLE